MVYLMDEIDLQLFAEGGDGAGAGDAGASDAGNAAQPEPERLPEHRHGRKPNPLANVQYGNQPDGEPATTNGGSDRDAAGEGAEPTREEWEQLKKGRYAKFYGDDVSDTVKSRLKNSKASEEALNKLQPMLEGMAKKYGKDVNDVDGLMAAYQDDDSLYEDEALERGIPVKTLKSMKQLERANAQYREQQERTAQQELFDNHLAGLEQQATAFQSVVPGFDLREALQDPRFARMTSPEGGLDVETAYFALHHNEMMQGMAQAAIQKTKQAVSNTIQAGAARPAENGTRRAAPGLDVRNDPRKFTKADREEIRRRVANGDKIYL